MAQLLVGKNRQPSNEIVAAFDDWANITSFGAFPEGYDAHDLFYWEIRMGSWMSSVLLESDIAHDTYTSINSRRILDLFLGVAREERISGMIARHLISSSWPELFNYPINGKMVTDPKG